MLVALVGAAIVGISRLGREDGGVAAGRPSVPPTGGFSGTDTAWIQLMIPMNEQLVAILELVQGRSADVRVQSLAPQISATRRAELTDLHRLRERAGLPPTNVHEGHDMPGMVTTEELDAIRAQRNAAFDTAVSAALREHLDQGARLAASECEYGIEPETRQLATRVHGVREAELGLLTAAVTT